jgi:hypothetical protein
MSIAFPSPGAAGRDELSLLDGEADAAERVHLDVAQPVAGDAPDV